MSVLPHGALFNALLEYAAADALDEDARRVDRIGIERSDRHQLFHFRNRDLAGRRHHRIEVPRRLAEDEIAFRVAFPRFDNGEIGLQSALEDVGLAVELLVLLAFGDQRADAGLGVEAGNSRAAGTDALGQRALRIEFEL